MNVRRNVGWGVEGGREVGVVRGSEEEGESVLEEHNTEVYTYLRAKRQTCDVDDVI